MRYINFLFKHGNYIGLILSILGIFLMPFLIGVPIFVVGILLVVFNFHKKLADALISQSTQGKIRKVVKESYVPYHSAINSMQTVGKDIAKTSLSVFIVMATIATIILYLRFGLGGPEDSWLCDKNGSWIKHGNPSYPSPVVSCDKKTLLPKNKDACLAENGIWQRRGPKSFESCNRKAVDRGNLCRDSSECEGVCQVTLTKEEMNLGMSGKLNVGNKTGQCSVWVVELGCFGIMEEGKARVICID